MDQATAANDLRALLAVAEEHGTGNGAYLERNVLPVLLPAMEELTRLVQRRVERGDAARPETRCVSQKHPTGAAHPTEWLAQRLLLRNGAAQKSVGAAASVQPNPTVAAYVASTQ